MGTASVVLFTLGFVSERWLRHTGKLAHNTSWTQKILSICAIIAAIAGAVGLVLLTIFDVLRHKHLHDTFLVLFMYALHFPYLILSPFVSLWRNITCGFHANRTSQTAPDTSSTRSSAAPNTNAWASTTENSASYATHSGSNSPSSSSKSDWPWHSELKTCTNPTT